MKPTNQSVKQLLNSIVAGIREKKGTEITVLDMTQLGTTICDYMVIAEGNTHTQVEALEDSVSDLVQKRTGEKPVHSHKGSGEWIAMDYIDVIVHLMTPELRNFYNIEQMWADADMQRLPNEA